MYKEIIINTFDSIFKNADSLLQKLLIPLVLISIINFSLPTIITNEFINSFSNNTYTIDMIIIPTILFFILMMSNISIAVTTHRVTILGKESVPKFGSIIFARREFIFLLKSIVMTIILIIPLIIISQIPVIGIFLTIALAFILASRFSFVFPAVACDNRMSFKNAWKATKDYKLLVFFSVIIFPLIFSISVGLVYTLAIEFLIKLVSQNLSFLYSFLNVFIMVFSISALSSTYSYIMPKPLNPKKKKVIDPIQNTIETYRNNLHKVIIDDRQKINFEALRKTVLEQYESIGFNDIVFEREKTLVLKNPNEIESYVSIKHHNNQYIIEAKKTKKFDFNI